MSQSKISRGRGDVKNFPAARILLPFHKSYNKEMISEKSRFTDSPRSLNKLTIFQGDIDPCPFGRHNVDLSEKQEISKEGMEQGD